MRGLGFPAGVLPALFLLALLSGVSAENWCRRFDPRSWLSPSGNQPQARDIQAEHHGNVGGGYDYGVPPPYGGETSATAETSNSVTHTFSNVSISQTVSVLTVTETEVISFSPSSKNPGSTASATFTFEGSSSVSSGSSATSTKSSSGSTGNSSKTTVPSSTESTAAPTTTFWVTVTKVDTVTHSSASSAATHLASSNGTLVASKASSSTVESSIAATSTGKNPDTSKAITISTSSTEVVHISTAVIVSSVTVYPSRLSSERSSRQSTTAPFFNHTSTSLGVSNSSIAPSFSIPFNWTKTSETTATSTYSWSTSARSSGPSANSPSVTWAITTILGTVTSVLIPVTRASSESPNSKITSTQVFSSFLGTGQASSVLNLTTITSWANISPTPPYPTNKNSSVAASATVFPLSGSNRRPSGTGYAETTTTIVRNSTYTPTSMSGSSRHLNVTSQSSVPPFSTPFNSTTAWYSTAIRTLISSTNIPPFPRPSNSTFASPSGTGVLSNSVSTLFPLPSNATRVVTITVTVGSSAILSGSLSSRSKPTDATSPPYPVGNSTIYAGPTGTGLATTITTVEAASSVTRSAIYTSSHIWNNSTSDTNVHSSTLVSGSMTTVASVSPTGTHNNVTSLVANSSTISSVWVSRVTLTKVITISPQPPYPTHNSTMMHRSSGSAPGTGQTWLSTAPYNSGTVATTCTSSEPYPYTNYTDSSTCITFTTGTSGVTRCFPIPSSSGNSGQNMMRIPTASPWSNVTLVDSSTLTDPYPMPTTFETSVKLSETGSDISEHPQPTGSKAAGAKLPSNPNYPWGGDSPMHRHQDVTQLSDGTGISGGIFRRLAKVVERAQGWWPVHQRHGRQEHQQGAQEK